MTETLAAHHRDRPLDEGADLGSVRAVVAAALGSAGAPEDPDLIDTLLNDLAARAIVVRADAALRLATHRVALVSRSAEVDDLLSAIGGGDEPAPPTIAELRSRGIGRDVIEAAARERLVVRVGPDLVFLPSFVERAEAVIRAASGGITVSAFREALGTSRKYAVPLLEWFDQRGVTRREGDLRFARER